MGTELLLKKIGFKYSNNHNKKNSQINTSSSFKYFSYDYFDNKKLNIGYGGYKYNKKYFHSVAKYLFKKFNLNNKKILEIGCAKGYLLKEFSRYNVKYQGIEISFYAKVKSHAITKDKIFLRKEINEKFDFIICLNVFCYLTNFQIKSFFNYIQKYNIRDYFIVIEYVSDPNIKKLLKTKDPNYINIKTKSEWSNFFKLHNICQKNVILRKIL